MSEVLKILRDSVIVALGGGLVTGAAFIIRAIYIKRRAKVDKRFALYAKLDELLTENHRLLMEIGGDVRCLYHIQMPQLEALEVSLLALHGEEINGNVGDAIKSVRDAKRAINEWLSDKTGCASMGEAD